MARRQSTHSELAATATTIALTLNGVAAGSLLVIIVGVVGSTTTTISGVQDDLGTVGVSVGRAVYATNGYGEIWYIKNATAGNRTVTVTYSATITNRYMCLIEADADTSSPLDQTAKKETQDSVNPNTAAVTTLADGEYCVALSAGIPGTSLTATSPYGDVYTPVTLNSWTIGVEDRIQATQGATNAAWTAANSSWFAILATFKATAVGADRDVIVRYGSMSAIDGSGLVMAAFASAAAAAVSGGGLYPFYYRTLVADD